MVVRHLRMVNELFAMFQQLTAEVQTLHSAASEGYHSMSLRSWERRLKELPASLLAQISRWVLAIDSIIL